MKIVTGVFKHATLVFFVFASLIAIADESVPVRLQLNGKAQFQYAGYYAAQLKGFYKAAGFSVKIIQGSERRNPIKEVSKRFADFGVSNSNILFDHLNGAPVQVISIVFQHSANAFITIDKNKINNPIDFKAKRILLNNALDSFITKAIITREEYPLDSLKLISEDYKIENLLKGKADVLIANAALEPLLIQKLGYNPIVIKPADYGLDFYGDLLFTSDDLIKENPSLVDAFTKASEDGWAYAMENPQEIIDYLLSLPEVKDRGINREMLDNEAAKTRELIITDLVEIGHSNPRRWEQMLNIYKVLKLIPETANINGLVYVSRQKSLKDWLFAILSVFAIISSGAIIIFVWNWKLRNRVTNKTIELQKEIDNRKIAETQAVESEEQLELAIKSANIGLWSWNPVDKKIFFSKQFYELLGIELRDIPANFNPLNLIHPDDRESFNKNQLSNKISNTNYTELRLKNVDGNYIYVFSTAKPIKNEENVLTKITGVIVNINPLKNKEHELVKVSEELMRSNSELKKFAYITSHNLRAPVVNISTLMEMVDKEQINSENSLIIEKLDASVKRLSSTMDDLIEVVSHDENEDTKLVPLSFDVEFDNALESMEYLIKDMNIKIEKDFSKAPLIRYSKKFLDSIYLNLLSNAIKFRSKERSLKIILSTEYTNNHVLLKVTDNGTGIDLKKNGHKIFGLYQRFHQQIDGKGIGLFIIKSHLESLNGKIEVESEPDKGTTFKLYFKRDTSN